MKLIRFFMYLLLPVTFFGAAALAGFFNMIYIFVGVGFCFLEGAMISYTYTTEKFSWQGYWDHAQRLADEALRGE